jgi:hypothetical protein
MAILDKADMISGGCDHQTNANCLAQATTRPTVGSYIQGSSAASNHYLLSSSAALCCLQQQLGPSHCDLAMAWAEWWPMVGWGRKWPKTMEDHRIW